ncbi:MAG: SemiSWEET transporter [Candidatus Korobacteraceae bacterium]|jgi:MtN3 and saliva related transmembrane protein
MLFTFIGFAAGALTTLAFLPQVLHTYRSKSVEGLSYTTLITFSVGVLLWFIYGVYLHSWPMILANGLTLVLQLPLLLMKVRYGRRGQA